MKKTVKRPAKPAPPKGTPASDVESDRPAGVNPALRQRQLFEEAVRLFHAGDFEQAKSLFEASDGPNRPMAHAARLHARMCEHRIAKAAPSLASAEDHYNFAIALMNQRTLERAEEHLRKALELSPDGDHLHYALALCRGLRGDVDAACKHLRRAIDLQPRNRLMARNDPDFFDLIHNPHVARVLNS